MFHVRKRSDLTPAFRTTLTALDRATAGLSPGPIGEFFIPTEIIGTATPIGIGLRAAIITGLTRIAPSHFPMASGGGECRPDRHAHSALLTDCDDCYAEVAPAQQFNRNIRRLLLNELPVRRRGRANCTSWRSVARGQSVGGIGQARKRDVISGPLLIRVT